jgi:hypothetical protein
MFTRRDSVRNQNETIAIASTFIAVSPAQLPSLLRNYQQIHSAITEKAQYCNARHCLTAASADASDNNNCIQLTIPSVLSCLNCYLELQLL